MKRGDLNGASFGFRTVADHWFTEHGIGVRELLDFDIAEISLTAFPGAGIIDRQLSLERLADRVEVLELELLHRREPPCTRERGP